MNDISVDHNSFDRFFAACTLSKMANWTSSQVK